MAVTEGNIQSAAAASPAAPATPAEPGTPAGTRFSFMSRMSRGQKIAAGAGGVLIIVAVALLLLNRAPGPRFVPLYTSLSTQDAAAIVSKLKETKIPYQLDDGGATIRVPDKDVYDLRLSLAEQGLPQGGGVGFEIFDRTSFGVTEFTQKVNYLRALQGELARTIAEMSEVDQARVHLVIPEQRLYEEKQQDATASVLLKLVPGATLTRRQVQGIVRLVASSVEGLKPENVTVLDIHGNILSNTGTGEDLALAALTTTQLEAKKAIEKDMESRLQSMLDRVLGPMKAVARVNADINFDKQESSSEIYEPGPNGQGIVRNSKKSEETVKITGGAAGAVPGVTSNVPTGGLGGIPTYQAVGPVGSEDRRKTEEITNYEITKRVEHTVKAPVELRKLSVAVMVDSSLQPAQVDAVRQAIAAAAGIDPARGDSLTVASVPFDTSWLDQERKAMELEAAAAARRAAGKGLAAALSSSLSYLIAGLILLILVTATLVILRRRRALAGATAGEEEFSGLEFMPQVAATAPQPEAEEEPEEAPEEQVARLARSQPENVARVIETLIEEGKK